MHQFRNITLLFLDLHLSTFNPAHIQNIVNQAEQMITGRKYFLQTVSYLIPVINMTGRNGGKSDNSVHRRTDVVGHIGQKCSLGPVSMLRLHQCVLERLGLFLLLLHLIGNLFGHNHDHNITRLVILCHNKRLPHTDTVTSQIVAPVFRYYFCVSLLKRLF